jgi:dephospho-CoA kinase
MISSAAMILVGLTGGIATGKSTVAGIFKRYGATVIDADVLAREVVQPGKPAWREIIETFGQTVINPDRTLNRQALGATVFGYPGKLRQLEQIIHPRVAREQIRLTKQAALNDSRAIVIYDVPLLFEAGIDRRVDTTIVVTADRETQIARLKKRNGLSRAEALRRIKSQMPLAEKRRRADHTLNGTLPLPQLKKQVRSLYQSMRAST